MNSMDTTTLKAYSHIYMYNKNSRVKRWFFVCVLVFLVFLFLPWTQNIRSRGTVTTLYQDQRPQEVNTIIGGRVMKWHIKEGDYVKAGDTLVQLTEVKTDYLDPNLLQRTQEQLAGKKMSVGFYKSKVNTADQQIGAITTESTG
jgi:multidrug efflux pump subunit AcrA (membrane-fusion protein)